MELTLSNRLKSRVFVRGVYFIHVGTKVSETTGIEANA